MIVNLEELLLPELAVQYRTRTTEKEQIRQEGPFHIQEADQEVALRGRERQVDILLQGEAPGDPLLGDRLAVEIAVSNPLDQQRIDWYRAQNLPCIEISLTGLHYDIGFEELHAALHECQRIAWIHHPATAAASSRLRDRLDAITIDPISIPSVEKQDMIDSYQTWRNKRLPANQSDDRQLYWERYSARLARYLLELQAVGSELGPAAYEKAREKSISQLQCGGWEAIEETIALYLEFAPQVLADAAAISNLARYISTNLAIDVEPLRAADVLHLMREDPAMNSVAELRDIGIEFVLHQADPNARHAAHYNAGRSELEAWLQKWSSMPFVRRRRIHCSACHTVFTATLDRRWKGEPVACDCGRLHAIPL